MKVSEFIKWLETQNQDTTVSVLCKRENSFYETISWEEFNPLKHVDLSWKDELCLGLTRSNNREQ